MKTSEQDLIERIQKHVSGATVIEARGLEIIGTGEEAIFPFAYRVEGIEGELRGAFTNGDPIWEEGEEEVFAEMMGESESV